MRNALLFVSVFIIILMSFSMPAFSEEELSLPLTLKKSIDIAISHNPRIASYRHLYKASLEYLSGASAQPNPTVTLAAVKGDAPEDSNIISQSFELFSRPRLRKDVALAAVQIEELRLRSEALTLISQVSLSYIDALKTQNLTRIEENNVKTAKEFLNVAERQYKVGEIPLFQVLQFKIECSRAEGELQAAMLEERKSILALSRLLNMDIPAGSSIAECLPAIKEKLPPLETLRAKAIASRPELLQSQWERKGKSAEKSLIIAEQEPDLILSAYRAELTSEARQGVRLSVAVPLLDWGSIKSQARAVEEREKAAEKSIDDTKRQIIWEVEDAYARVESLKNQLDIYSFDVLREQERLMSMIQRGYEAGLYTYVEVLQTRQSQKEMQKKYCETTAEYKKALINLERALGEELFVKEEVPDR
ncbi:MAG: TolC family protein [Vulcanimicrobiota bacterium]